jgi:GntR family transcriptional regulator
LRTACTIRTMRCHGTHGKPTVKISLDIDDPVPPFAQLMAQIKTAVQSGGLQPGESLPSIRQLANNLALNPKTVAKAYRLLERDAVIQTRGYRGSFVHPDAAANCRVDLSERAHERLRDTIAELRAAGVTDSELRNAFNRSMNGGHNK